MHPSLTFLFVLLNDVVDQFSDYFYKIVAAIPLLIVLIVIFRKEIFKRFPAIKVPRIPKITVLSKRNGLRIVIGFMAILILTNPSMRQFREYSGTTGRRTSNWIIFSVYKTEDNISYLAVFNNFYKL